MFTNSPNREDRWSTQWALTRLVKGGLKRFISPPAKRVNFIANSRIISITMRSTERQTGTGGRQTSGSDNVNWIGPTRRQLWHQTNGNRLQTCKVSGYPWNIPPADFTRMSKCFQKCIKYVWKGVLISSNLEELEHFSIYTKMRFWPKNIIYLHNTTFLQMIFIFQIIIILVFMIITI